MAPLTPADYKNEPLASFLSAFFPGAYLLGGREGGSGEQHAYRTVPAWRRSCGPMSAPEGPKPLVRFFENTNMCRGKMVEIIQHTVSA